MTTPRTPRTPRVPSAAKTTADQDAERLSPAPHLRALGLPPRPVFYRRLITKPLTPAEVEAAVLAAGWPDEGHREVISTLNYLVRQRKLTVQSTESGKVYAPAGR
jgi:hypothetical protein